MKRAQAFKKSEYSEKVASNSFPEKSPQQPFEAPFENVVTGAHQLCYKALGELRGDAAEVGKALSGFPYGSAARLVGATIFVFVLLKLCKEFGSMKSKLNRFMR